MKRSFCLFLCALLLCGCGSGKKQDTTVAFYYCKNTASDSAQERIVAPEYRDISASPTDLKNILSLYLIGPMDEDLSSPFQGMRLVSVETAQSQLIVELSCNDRSLTDIHFNLACACITMTCLELADISTATVSCGERSATMSRDNLLIFDSMTYLDSSSEERK